MKLTVNSRLIALPVATTISIERTSPLLNEDTGSFSYPFAVPTLPNQHHLGWPGKLQRAGDIAVQSFVLEDAGIQILRGQVDYDEVTANEIGLVLQSGNTEFTRQIEGKMLTDLDYGSEWWPGSSFEYINIPSLDDKLTEWDAANTTDNGKYVVTPFIVTDVNGPFEVNRQDWSGAGLTHLKYGYFENLYLNANGYGAFCLQFKVSFVLQTIFESQGYAITENNFADAEFNKAIFFGKIMSIYHTGLSKLSLEFNPLQLSTLMPDNSH